MLAFGDHFLQLPVVESDPRQCTVRASRPRAGGLTQHLCGCPADVHRSCACSAAQTTSCLSLQPTASGTCFHAKKRQTWPSEAPSGPASEAQHPTRRAAWARASSCAVPSNAAAATTSRWRSWTSAAGRRASRASPRCWLRNAAATLRISARAFRVPGSDAAAAGTGMMGQTASRITRTSRRHWRTTAAYAWGARTRQRCTTRRRRQRKQRQLRKARRIRRAARGGTQPTARQTRGAGRRAAAATTRVPQVWHGAGACRAFTYCRIRRTVRPMASGRSRKQQQQQ